MKYTLSYSTTSGPTWWECGDGKLEEVVRAAAEDKRRTGLIQIRVAPDLMERAPKPKTPYSQLRFDVV